MEFINDQQQPKQLENESKTDFVAVLGAKGSGKTLFTTALLASIIDGAVEGMVGTVSQSTHEFLSRHLVPMRQSRKWPEPTRGWHDLTLSLRWEKHNGKFKDHRLTFQDIQGSDFETLTPQLVESMRGARAYVFVVSPKHLLTQDELIKAAGENAYLESILPEEERFARQVNWNYSQALEKIVKKSGINKDVKEQKTSAPIAIVFTRKDDYPNLDIKLLKKKFLGAFRWFKAHARYVEFFFVSSVGKTIEPDPEQDQKNKEVLASQYQNLDMSLPAKKSPPQEIEPEGVVDPLRFIIRSFSEEKTRKIRLYVRYASIITITFCSLMIVNWLGNWIYRSYLHAQNRSEDAAILQQYIDKNPEQVREVYSKITQYLNTYGNNHSEGQEFLAVQRRLSPQVREKWYQSVLEKAQEYDADDKSVAGYQGACLAIEEYLASEFVEGKERLREILERLKQRKILAQTLEESKQAREHGDFRYALAVLEKYLNSQNFQKSLVLEKYKKMHKVFSANLYQKAIEEVTPFRVPGKLEEGIARLEVFLKKEKQYLEDQEIDRLKSQIMELQAKQAQVASEESFQKRNYRKARLILENFVKQEEIPVRIKNEITEELQNLHFKEYDYEIRYCMSSKGQERLDALASFQDQYSEHPSYSKGAFMEVICNALGEIAKEAEQTSNWEESINVFNREEQRFPDLVTLPMFWKSFLPLLYGRVWMLADQGEYENAWTLLKNYQVKLSGQLKLKKMADEVEQWAKKLAQMELDNKWKGVLLVQKPQEMILALEKFRQYQNQPFFSDVYRTKYKTKVDESRMQLALKLYQTALSQNDFAQARIVLEQYEGWSNENAAKIAELKQAVDKQEILNLWQECLAKAGTSFLATSQKIEAVEAFQKHNSERAGYKYIEEEVEIYLNTFKNKLKEERQHQLQRQIAYTFDDETALPKAQELFEAYQKNYPADKDINRFQAQIHQAQVSWAKRHLQACGDSYKPSAKYEAYERFIRRYSSNHYLYREILQKAEQLKEETALEWDRQEFQKAESAWKEFQYRSDEFPAPEGRQRLKELIDLYQDYTKHWGPKKNFDTQAREQILYINQLLNGAKYTVRLVKGAFAENYWVYNPTVEVTVTVGDVTYPYKVYKDEQKVEWSEDKVFQWKAYQPIKLSVKDRDKSENNQLILHQEVGFLSLFKFCTSEDEERRAVAFREIKTANNKIVFRLVSSSVAQINQKYGLTGKTVDSSESE